MLLLAHVTWAQETPIATGGMHQHSPTGDELEVWVDQPALQNAPSNIMVRDATGLVTQITNGGMNTQPSTSGDLIAWTCRGPSDNYPQICRCIYGAGSCPVVVVTNRLADASKLHGPARVHLSRIVYPENSPGQTPTVVLFDVATSNRDTFGTGIYPDLDALRGVIAFLRQVSGGYQLRVVAMSGATLRVYALPGFPSWGRPIIDRQGDLIVLPREDANLWVYGIFATSSTSIPLSGTQSQAVIRAGTLLWNDNPDFDSEVRGCRLPVCIPVVVADNPDLHDVAPTFAGENILFTRMNTPLEGDIIQVPLPPSLQ